MNVSSEIFQRKLDEALDDMERVFSIVDDIAVAGCSDTEELYRPGNQQKLQKVYQRHCSGRDQTGNRTEINLHGHRFTKDGVLVDGQKFGSCAIQTKLCSN